MTGGLYRDFYGNELHGDGREPYDPPVIRESFPVNPQPKESKCFGHPECPMTAGYYLGGGMWICWLHALYDSTILRVISDTGQLMRALPK